MNFEIEINVLIEAYRQSEDGISRFRDSVFNAQYEYYLKNGLPERCSILKLSLVPGHFQEANYDIINWSNQQEYLEQLTQSFEIDCMFHNNGKSRKELSVKEFEEFIVFSQKAIQAAKNKNSNNTITESFTWKEFEELVKLDNKLQAEKRYLWSWLKGKA